MWSKLIVNRCLIIPLFTSITYVYGKAFVLCTGMHSLKYVYNHTFCKGHVGSVTRVSVVYNEQKKSLCDLIQVFNKLLSYVHT